MKESRRASAAPTTDSAREPVPSSMSRATGISTCSSPERANETPLLYRNDGADNRDNATLAVDLVDPLTPGNPWGMAHMLWSHRLPGAPRASRPNSC